MANGSNLTISPLYSTTGLVGYWPFEEGTGSSTADQSGSGNGGSWYGTPAGTNGTYYTGGKVGSYAGSFEGTGFVSLGNNSSLNDTGDITFVFWIDKTPTSVNNYPTFYNKNGQACSAGYIWMYLRSGALTYEYANGSTCQAKTLLNATQSSVNGWTQFAVIHLRSTKTIYAYVNGVQISSTTYGDTALPVNSGNAYIGTYQGNANYDPTTDMDDFRIYNRALSASEVQALYNAEK
jgi:hypothetical protein